MCTKEEVRQVVRSEAPAKWPPILLNISMSVMVGLMGWLLYNANLMSTIISDERTVHQVAMATLSGRLEVLATEITNFKTSLKVGTNDRWYRKDAIGRIALENELFKATHLRHDMSQERQDRIEHRIDDLEATMKELHPTGYNK